MLTCHKCGIELVSHSAARSHYSSKWHEFNVMGAVKGLQPVTLLEYNTMCQQLLERDKQEEHNFWCASCKKTFSSNGSYHSHLKSHRHKERQEKVSFLLEEKDDAIHEKGSTEHEQHMEKCTTTDSQRHSSAEVIGCTDDSDSWEELSDGDCSDGSEMLPEEMTALNGPVPCLLCDASFTRLPATLSHLRVTHGFVVPLQRLCRVELLYATLTDWVCRRRRCVQCCRVYCSVQACRQHMLHTRHLSPRLPSVQRCYQAEQCELVSLPSAHSSSGVFLARLPRGGPVLVPRSLALYCRQRLRRTPLPPPRPSKHNLAITSAGGGTTMGVTCSRGVKQRRSRASIALAVAANRLQHHYRPKVDRAG